MGSHTTSFVIKKKMGFLDGLIPKSKTGPDKEEEW